MKLIQVSKTFYRGDRPDSQSFPMLATLGIKTVLSLERGYFDLLHSQVNQEVEAGASQKIVVIHLELGDSFAPTHGELQAIQNFVTDPALRPMLVHCLHGNDRTGLAVAIERVCVEGWYINDAITEMYDKGFHKIPYCYLGWVEALWGFLRDYNLKKLGGPMRLRDVEGFGPVGTNGPNLVSVPTDPELLQQIEDSKKQERAYRSIEAAWEENRKRLEY